MITRVIVIDPRPRDPRDDVIVYQVPDKSRAYELLIEMLEERHLEFIEIESTKKLKEKTK
jgi:hypothetical protein